MTKGRKWRIKSYSINQTFNDYKIDNFWLLPLMSRTICVRMWKVTNPDHFTVVSFFFGLPTNARNSFEIPNVPAILTINKTTNLTQYSACHSKNERKKNKKKNPRPIDSQANAQKASLGFFLLMDELGLVRSCEAVSKSGHWEKCTGFSSMCKTYGFIDHLNSYSFNKLSMSCDVRFPFSNDNVTLCASNTFFFFYKNHLCFSFIL